MLHKNISINADGHLTFAGMDVVSLAEKYGTPLMLLDEDRIRENIRVYKAAMREHFGADSFPLFASKALCFKGVYRIAKEEEIGVDAVSVRRMLRSHACASSSGFWASSKPASRAAIRNWMA